LSIFVILQIYIDTKDIIQSKKIQRDLIAIAKKQSEKTFGIIIELSRPSETAIPLLEHLIAQNYSKLEIFIIINKTANKNSKTVLNQFRKVSHLRNLHIINYKKDVKLERITRQIKSIDLVMLMKTSQRLSINFFTLASIETLSMADGFILMPRQHLMLDEFLSSAMVVHRSILWQQTSNLFGAKAPQLLFMDGLIYSQKALRYDSAEKYSRLQACRSIFVSDLVPTCTYIEYINQQIDVAVGQLKSKYGLSIFMMAIAIITLTIVLLDLDFFLMITLIIMIMYCLASLTAQLRLQGYNLIENISLVLITPLNLIFLAIIYILGFIKYIISIMVIAKK